MTVASSAFVGKGRSGEAADAGKKVFLVSVAA